MGARVKNTSPEASTLSCHCLSCEADLGQGYLSKRTFETNSDDTSSAQTEGAALVDQALILNVSTPVRQPRMSRVGRFDGQWPSFDVYDVAGDASCSPMSYREYLQSRGSEVLQLARSKRAADMCSTRSVSPSVPEALRQQIAPSPTVPLILGWNADSSSWSTNTPTSDCSMHTSPSSLSDCSQATQPLIDHLASQQLHGNNQQCSLQMGCEHSCFVGHNVPVTSDFTQQTLHRAVTMPNLWSMCDGSPHSPDGPRTERDLMAIAMPDAFSLSSAEIVSQLKSAAPCTYED